jgi:hypothetical protein
MQHIYSKIHPIISNILSSDIDIENYELEMRFGKKKQGKFDPNIDSVFNEIYELVKKGKIVENAYIYDSIYEEGIDRKIYKKNEIMFNKKYYPKYDDKFDMIKIKKEKINQFTFDYVRLSFNKEHLVNFNSEYLQLKFERMKYRLSIMFGDIFRFDFTIANEKDYSVEIETLLPNIKNIEHFESEFKKLQTLLSSITTKFEKDIINNIESQNPHTMNFSNLFTIISNKYTVTEKADGVRAFIKILDNKVTLLNPKTKEIIKDLGNIQGLKSTLIDGEYVNSRFYAFDLMYYDGEDFRSKNLIERLDALKKAIDRIQIGFYIKIKKFYFTDIFQNAKKILNGNHPYNIDGLIFTPVYQNYIEGVRQDKPIFKWKMRHTIDVRVKYNKKEDFTYFIYGKKFGRINRWSPEFFEKEYIRTRDQRIQKMYNTFQDKKYQKLKAKSIHFGKYKMFNSNIFQGFLGKRGKPNQDSITGRPLNRNMDVILDKYDIIEYEYRNEEWYPLKKRTFDKENPNAVKTIGGVLKVIEEEVTIDKMIDFENEYKSNMSSDIIGSIYNDVAEDKSIKRDNWRKFHNFAKRETILYGSNNCVGGSYLDLACGKGGDLGKYMNLGYKNVLAIDSSNIELYGNNGFVHRLLNYGFINKGLYFEKNNLKITVVCGDVSKNIRTGECSEDNNDKNKLKDFFNRVDKFDCISMMFSIHYMFGDFINGKWENNEEKVESFFTNIKELLKSSGKFVGTYLNSENNNKVEKFMNHGIPFYQIKDMGSVVEINNDVWGWENTLSEPKISVNYLSEIFESNNLVEVDNETFEFYYNDFRMKEDIILTNDEQKLGFKNNYFMCMLSPSFITKGFKL